MSFGRSKLSLALLLLGLVSYNAQAQRTPAGSSGTKKAPAAPAPAPQAPAGWSEWENFSPEGEEFTVSMPKSPSSEITTFPYHKMELKARLYISSIPGGPVVAITSLSGIKSDPSQYSDFSRFNSYVDAFKDFFPAKVRPKETVARLILVSSKPYKGHTGRSYKMTLGDLSGVVHAYATRKRFYAIVSLNTKKDEALEEKFLSSFTLPERQQEPAKTTAANEGELPANNGGLVTDKEENATQGNDGRRPVRQGGAASTVGVPVGVEDNTEAVVANVPAGGQQQTDQNQNQNQGQGGNQKKGPINGGMLNGKAIYLPLPESPNREVSGVVMVQILVDEQGAVIDARAVSGPAVLHAAAVNAARLARFSTTLLMGEPVRVSGTLAYSFSKSN